MFEGWRWYDWIGVIYTFGLWGIFKILKKKGVPMGKILLSVVGLFMIFIIGGLAYSNTDSGKAHNLTAAYNTNNLQSAQRMLKDFPDATTEDGLSVNDVIKKIEANLKAEADRVAKEKAKVETDRIAKEKAEDERIANEKEEAKAEKIANEKINKPFKIKIKYIIRFKSYLTITNKDSEYIVNMKKKSNANAEVLKAGTDYEINYKNGILKIGSVEMKNSIIIKDEREITIKLSDISNIQIYKYEFKNRIGDGMKKLDDSYKLVIRSRGKLINEKRTFLMAFDSNQETTNKELISTYIVSNNKIDLMKLKDNLLERNSDIIMENR